MLCCAAPPKGGYFEDPESLERILLRNCTCHGTMATLQLCDFPDCARTARFFSDRDGWCFDHYRIDRGEPVCPECDEGIDFHPLARSHSHEWLLLGQCDCSKWTVGPRFIAQDRFCQACPPPFAPYRDPITDAHYGEACEVCEEEKTIPISYQEW